MYSKNSNNEKIFQINKKFKKTHS